MNCYHSPKKQVQQQLLPIINTPDRSVVGRKAINLKKNKAAAEKDTNKTSLWQLNPSKAKKTEKLSHERCNQNINFAS